MNPMKPTMYEAMTAIRAKCMECSGNSRREVERCRIKDCPLYPYRSMKAIGGGSERRVELEGQIRIFDIIQGGAKKVAHG